MLKRIQTLFGGRGGASEACEAAFKSVMDAARRSEFFEAGMAPDTREGRFGIVTLHAALIMRRLRDCGAEGRALSDCLYKQLFSSFDYALREEGVGDSSIARKIRGMGEEFFGLARALDQALGSNADDAAIADILSRNGLGGDNPARLSSFALRQAAEFSDQPEEALLRGDFGWADLSA